MNDLQIFDNPEFGEIRTIMIDDEPWFVGNDIAKALGYTNPRKALIDHVDERDKGVTKCDTLGGSQNMTIINESGLYGLIFTSKLEKAKEFKYWVTSEVLPALRKTGSYSMSKNAVPKFTMEQWMTPGFAEGILETIVDLRERVERNEIMISVQTQQIAEMKPKASYYDVVINCKDLISVTEFAKDYGWSACKMNKVLQEKGIQYKQGKHWFLYQKYAEYGYTSTKTHTYHKNDGTDGCNIHMYWTQKGRLFVYDLLKEDGILPLIERGSEDKTSSEGELNE